MTALLQAQDLACIRGDRRLFARLSLALPAGQLLRVQGANGAGKTSLLRLLAGLGLPAAGEVLWRGKPVRASREAYARELLYLGHLPALKEELSPLDNLLAQARIAGRALDENAAREALAAYGLARELQLPTRVLSAGQRRRAALARLSLAREQTLWILDEPFNALDVKAVAFLGEVLASHVRAGGAVVLTTHQDVPLDIAAQASLQVDAYA